MEPRPKPDPITLPDELTIERVESAAREFTWVFHELKQQTFASTTWLRVPLLKTPTDILVFQQIIAETSPDLIVETGVYLGGSALLFASVQEALGIDGKVIAVDIDLSMVHKRVRDHPRIELIEGSSTDPDVVERIREAAEGRRVMVDLDSDHRAHHVLEELRLFSPLVSPGAYLVVEDCFMGGRPVRPDAIPGPSEALEAWLAESPPFESDRWRERYLLTQNPRGYLRRNGELEEGPQRNPRPAGVVIGSLELTPGGAGTSEGDPERSVEKLEAAAGEADNEVEALRSWAAGGENRAQGRSIENLMAELQAQSEVLHERTRELARDQAQLKRIRGSRTYRAYKRLRGLPGIRQIAARRDRRRREIAEARRADRAKHRRKATDRFMDSPRGQ